MESALYKIATPQLLKNKEISKSIRLYDGKIVEVNPTYAIVSKEGLTDEIVALYRRLKECDCLLQYVRSGAIAVTKSHTEELNEFLKQRELDFEAQKNIPHQPHRIMNEATDSIGRYHFVVEPFHEDLPGTCHGTC